MSSDTSTEVRNQREEVQSSWKVPAIGQFVSLYRFAFKLPELEIEELEDGLLQDNELGKKVLDDLLLALMKGGVKRTVNSETFESDLRKQSLKFWESEKTGDFPHPEETKFAQFDLQLKVDVLYFLCLRRLDYFDAQEALKKMDADALRVQPLGCDDLGNEYWYFFGTRLYKQEPSKEKKKNWEDEWNKQKNQSFTKRGRGRPRKSKPRKSDGESDDFEDVGCGKSNGYMNIDEKSRWSVVCNTIEDWVDFAEKYQNSKSKCEKALFQTVKNNFLPVLNEIYQEKERRLQQKLRELIPKRTVTRRETRSQRIRLERSMEVSDYDPETAHKEHLARDRANRLEERNRRLNEVSERQQKRPRSKSYYEDDDYEDDSEWMDETTAKSYHTSDSEDSTPASTNSSELKSQVLKVLSEVKLQKDAWPFLHPVDETYAPGYYEIITDPMDLSTMSSKLLGNNYKTISDLDDDFRLMVSNCKLYNGELSDMSNMVMNLWRVFRNGMARISEKRTPLASKKSVHDDDSHQMEGMGQVSTKPKKAPSKKIADLIEEKRNKRKRKSRQMEALEILSKETELAVERTQNMDKDILPQSQFSLYSDLKIIPIHSHPTAMIERYTSDSSNQDSELDTSNSSYGNQNPNSSSPFERVEGPIKDQTKSGNFLDQKEDSNDLSEFINNSNTKTFNILSDGEGGNPGMLSDVETDLNAATKNSTALAKATSGGLMHGISNILEDCNTDNVTSLRNALYGTSPLNEPVASSSPGYMRKSPNFTFNTFDRMNPTIQDGVSHSVATTSSPTGDISTVDASAIGISLNHQSHFKNKDSSTSQLASQPSVASQIASQPLIVNLNTNQETDNRQLPCTKTSQISPKEKSPSYQMLHNQNQFFNINQFEQSSPQQSSQTVLPSTMGMNFSSSNLSTFATIASQSTMKSSAPFPSTVQYQNQNSLLKTAMSENNRPVMKMNLPPSSSELLVVPGEKGSSSMTFHLYAQPASNPSQRIESHLQMQFNPMIKNSNQKSTIATHIPNNLLKGQTRQDTAVRPTQQKSPIQDVQQPARITTSTAAFTVPYNTASTIKNILKAPASTTKSDSNSTTTLSTNPTIIRPSVLKNLTTSNSALSIDSVRNSNPFMPNTTQYQTMCTTSAPVAFPTYSYRLASINGSNTVTSFSSPPRPTFQKIYLPEGAIQLTPSTIMPNGNGQFILMPPPVSKDGTKKLTHTEVGDRSVARTMPEAAPFYPGPSDNVLSTQNQTGSSSQVLTQVHPGQLPQFVNSPYYIVTDPNSFQNQPRYPMMNMQPIPYPNR